MEQHKQEILKFVEDKDKEIADRDKQIEELKFKLTDTPVL